MTCPRCGRGSDAGAQWCVACGSALSGEARAVERVDVELEPRPHGGGPGAPFASLEPDTVRLMPRAEATVKLRIAPPRGPHPPAGRLGLVVDVYAGDAALLLAQGDGEIEIRPFDHLVARVVPSAGRAWRQRDYRLDVQNHGNAHAHVSLSGTDPDDELILSVAPAQLDLAPTEQAQAAVHVRTRGWRPVGRPVDRPFSVVMRSEGDTSLQRDARLVQRALVTGLGIALAVLIVALAVAGVASEVGVP